MGDTIEVGDIISMPSGIILDRGVKIIGPAYIGKHSRIDEGAIIGPRASLGKKTHIPEKCKVVNSILFDSPALQKGAQYRNIIANTSNIMYGVE